MLALTACAADDRRPVTLDKPDPRETGAVVLVIDRSGSMRGLKLEAVKDAATATVEALDATDQIAIVTFDSLADVPVPLQPSTNRAQIAADIATIEAGGGTKMLPGLDAAAQILSRSHAQHRHVLLLSDGEAAVDGLLELAREMKAQHITLSTVAIDGADETFLEKLSAAGGGQAYRITDLATLEQTFVNDTRIALH